MPVSEIRFFRLHITEEAARAAAMNDLEAFKAEFPEALIPLGPKERMLDRLFEGSTYPEDRTYREVILHERYESEGLVACILYININTDNEPGVGGWLQRLYQGKLIESNPLRR